MNIPKLPELQNEFISKDGEIISTTVEGFTVANIRVYINEDGRIICDGQRDIFEGPMPSKFSFSFLSSDGWEIVIEDCYASGVLPAFNGWCIKFSAKRGSINSDDNIQYFRIVERLVFSGNITPGGGRRLNDIESFFEFTPDDIKDIALIEGAETFLPESTGYFYLDTEYGSLNQYDEGFDDLYFLLSFAAGRYIRIGFEYITGTNGYQEMKCTSGIAELGGGSGLLYLRYPGALGNFIDKCYGNYRQLKGALGLKNIFHYYIFMKNSHFIGNKYLLGSVLMEGLKYNFAKNYRNYSQNNNGFFLKPGTSKETYKFKELIEEVYDEFGITNGDLEFIDYRNEVIHTGNINWPDSHILDLSKKEYEFQDFIGCLLLKILGYDGLVWNQKANDGGKWVGFNGLNIFK